MPQTRARGPWTPLQLDVFVFTFLYAASCTVNHPLMPLAAKRLAGEELPIILGVLGASFPVCKAIGAPLLGWLADVTGRRRVMAATTALSGVLFVLVAYSPSLPQLLLWRTSAGLLCANTVLVTSFIADSTSVQNRPPVLAVFGLAWALAGVCAGSVVWLSGSDVAVCAGSALICMLAASAYALMRLGGGSVQVSSGSAVTTSRDQTNSSSNLNNSSNPSNNHPSQGSSAAVKSNGAKKRASMLSALRELLSQPLSLRVFLASVFTPYYDITPLTMALYNGDTSVTGLVKALSSVFGVLLPLLPVTSSLQSTGLHPAALASVGLLLTAVSMVGIGAHSSVSALVFWCVAREIVTVCFKPFMTTVLSTSSGGSSGAFNGWRETLTATASAFASVLFGWVTVWGGYRLPYFLSVVGLSAQALAFYAHSRREGGAQSKDE